MHPEKLSIMKKIISISVLFLVVFLMAASTPPNLDSDLDKFIGIWEYKKDSKIFRIEIWKNQEDTGIKGHYWLLVIDRTGMEQIIDQSNKEILTSSNKFWTEAFSAYSKDGIELRGLIRDVTPLPKDVTWIDGLLKMTIIAQPKGTPKKAHWMVRYEGPIYYDARFQIPTNCILTKVE